MPFRNLREKNVGFKKIDTNLSVYFGIFNEHNQIDLECYKYLDNYLYEDSISKLSNTVVKWIDPEEMIDQSIIYKEQFDFENNLIYMGSCEMFFYFYEYVSNSGKTDEEVDETIKYYSLDHETGEMEYKTSILGNWLDYSHNMVSI